MTTLPVDLAFPLVTTPLQGQAGLTKREYFAALALQGLLVSDKTTVDEATKWAVYAADCLIEDLNDYPAEGQQ